YRDIAQWVDWAFSLESPAGFTGSHTLESSQISIAMKTPTPTPKPRSEDDEAVDIAWGGGEVGAPAPVVLDDVPDVSSKIRIPDPESEDDQPTPAPRARRKSGLDTNDRSAPPIRTDSIANVAVAADSDVVELRIPRIKP